MKGKGAILCLFFLAVPICHIAYCKQSITLIPFQENGKWGYKDEKGKIIIEAKFIQARPFSEGLAAVGIAVNAKPEEVQVIQLTGQYVKWGFISQNGQMVIKPKYAEVGDFSEGYARVREDHPSMNGKWGYINEKGEEVIKPQYYSADDFEGGRARVSIGELRVIGRQGSVVKVKFYGKHGYIDKSGKFTRTSAKERYDGKGAV